MALTIDIEHHGQDITVTFRGMLDENALELPHFSQPITGRVYLKLGELTLINSLGCRKWVQWVRDEMKAKQGVFLLECNPAVVNQLNILEGFIPEGSTIESFYVPYFCESCGYDTVVLFENNKDYIEGVESPLMRSPDEAHCPSCQGAMALDAVKARYFKFLGRKPSAA